jgi:NodT family efflux transporter outer membrane factor (OMF) lipoprotein
LLTAGCVVGPKHQAPVPPAGAEAPLQSVDPAVEAVIQPPDAWWRLYRDPRLDRLVEEALAANPDLKAAEANLTAARAVLAGARADLYPSTEIALQAKRGRDGVTNEILAFTGRKAFTIWLDEALINISYELDFFGRVRRSIQAARADAEASQAARDQARITVVAETTRAFASICALGEQIAVAKASVATVSRQAQITANRLAAGGGSRFDVVRAQQLVAQTEAAVPPLEGQRRAAGLELAALLGRTPAEAPHEADACTAPPQLLAPLPVGDGASLLKRRPDIREAERRLAGSAARVGVATADLYPKFTFTGLYGGVNLDWPDLFNANGLTWGVGPAVSWAFPNQIAARARLRQARAMHESELEAFDSTVLKALKETEQALVAYHADLDRRRSLDESQAKARQAFNIARSSYLAGAISDLDLLTTEETLINADSAVAASDAALIQDQIAIFKALGGGWRIVNEEIQPPLKRSGSASRGRELRGQSRDHR